MEEKFDIDRILTRDKDTFIPVEKRTAFENVNKADLFISLHINAHKQPDVHGFERYFLNMATDERAVLVPHEKTHPPRRASATFNPF